MQKRKNKSESCETRENIQTMTDTTNESKETKSEYKIIKLRFHLCLRFITTTTLSIITPSSQGKPALGRTHPTILPNTFTFLGQYSIYFICNMLDILSPC